MKLRARINFYEVIRSEISTGAQLGIFEGWGPTHEKGDIKLFKRRYDM